MTSKGSRDKWDTNNKYYQKESFFKVALKKVDLLAKRRWIHHKKNR